MPHCRIEVLGGLRVVFVDRTINRFQTQKTGALLAYLAINLPRSFARESLAELLWPGDNSVAIRNRLNQAVSSLRRQLHPPGSSRAALLVADHHSISLNAEAVTTDYHEFLGLLDQAASSTSDAEAAAFRENAVGLYAGRLLDGYREKWASLERVRLSALFDECLGSLIRHHARLEDFDKAIAYAASRVRHDEMLEKSHRTLIRLYLNAGRPESAIAQIDHLTRLLRSGGREPSEQVQELARIAHSLSRKPPGAPIKTAADRRRRIAHDVDEPLTPRAVISERAPTPSSLPVYASRFINRAEELSALHRLLVESRTGLVCVTGLGGMGKTRLVVEFAQSAASHFDPRIEFVSFADGPAEGEVASRIEALASQRIQDSSPLSSEKPRLIILDNLEDLPQDQLPKLKELIVGEGKCQVLVTSRHPTGISGEVCLPILPLSVEEIDPESDLVKLAENHAIALFVHYAQCARQDFQLTERNAQAIAMIVQKLEGLPLALELAAAWSRTMSPSQMLDQLSQDLHSLTGRRRDVPARHISVSATLDRSYALLNPQEQEVFFRLAVFQSSFDHRAAQAVCPGFDVGTILHSLSERSIIQTSLCPACDQIQFSMLRTLRVYALTRISHAMDRDRTQLMADHVRVRLKEAIGNLTKLRLSERWRENLEVALDWYAAEAPDHEEAQDLAADYGLFAIANHRIPEALSLIAKFLEVPEPSPRLMAVYGLLLVEQARFDQATELIERALRSAGDSPHEDILLAAGLLAAAEGHPDEACTLLRQVLSRPGARGQTIAAAHLGDIVGTTRPLDEAVEANREAMRLARNGQDPCAERWSRINLALLFLRSGQLEASRRLLDEASLYQPKFENAIDRAHLRLAQAEYMLADGQHEDALAELNRSVIKPDPLSWYWVRRCELVSQALLALGRPTASAEILGQMVAARCVPPSALVNRLRDQLIDELGESRFHQHWMVGSLLSTAEAERIVSGSSIDL